jgi:hypothetical protein
MKITEITPIDSTLAFKEFKQIDYQDSFEIIGSFKSVDEFAKEYFLSQPLWLSVVSMNIFSKKSIKKAIDKSLFTQDSSIGSWKIYTRDEKEIVFGDDMGFMEYRFFMLWVDETKVKVGTVVQFKGRFGKYYFAMVKLMHKKFIRMSLSSLSKV